MFENKVDPSIRLFTFWWDDVGYFGGDWFWSFRDAHNIFNQAFAMAFPKLLYTNPLTSYNEKGIGIGSRITGTAETRYSDAQIRAWVKSAVGSVGLSGDESKLHVSAFSIEDIQAGSQLTMPGSTVNPLATTDGQRDMFDNLWKEYQIPIYLMGALLLVLAIRR